MNIIDHEESPIIESNISPLDAILKDADVVLATLEEAAALVDAGAASGGNGVADAGHGALGGTAVGAGALGEPGSKLDPAIVATQLRQFRTLGPRQLLRGTAPCVRFALQHPSAQS